MKCDGSENDEIVSDFVDRRVGKHELALGFSQDALANQVTGGDAGRAFDVIVEPVRRHGELVRVEAQQALLAELLFHQCAQAFHGRISRCERHASGARLACGEPHHLDRDQRQVAAHGVAIALARQESLLVQLAAQFVQARELRLTERHHRMRRKRAQTRDRLAGVVAQRMRHVLGEAYDPAFGSVWLEPIAMRDSGRCEQRARRLERQECGLVGHVAAAAGDHQDLEQIAVAVRADGPIMDRRAR